jgi:formylglycine-generating enzyme required for sulfatase activity/class 3 adenylate cyclase
VHGAVSGVGKSANKVKCIGRTGEFMTVPERSFHLSRRSAAILYADIIDYGRLVEADDQGTYARVRRHLREVIDPVIAEHFGLVAKSTGDGFLAVFDSPLEAVRCAIVIQQAMDARNSSLAPHQWMQHRMGINYGDVILEPDDTFGQGVNVAARLQSLAEPGSLYISGDVYDRIQDLLGCAYQSLGDERLNNAAEPVRVYRVQLSPTAMPRLKENRRVNWLAVALAVNILALFGGGWFVWRGLVDMRVVEARLTPDPSPVAAEPPASDQRPLAIAVAPPTESPTVLPMPAGSDRRAAARQVVVPDDSELRSTERPAPVPAGPAQGLARAAGLPSTAQPVLLPEQRPNASAPGQSAIERPAITPSSAASEQHTVAGTSTVATSLEPRPIESSIAALPVPAQPAPVDPAAAPKFLQQAVVGRPFRAVTHRPSIPRQILRDCDQCPELLEIPGGSFTMGSNDDPTEKPPHRVSVGAFALGRFAVTNGEWRRCVAAQVCRYQPSGSDDLPVHNVSWTDAQQYVTWLSLLTGQKYRLPTEAEWEYAARATTSTRYWWGNQIVVDMANCKGCGEPYDTAEPVKVGNYEPNPYGVYDMAGGVAQWTSDCWHKDYQGAPKDASTWDSANCRERVLRGGSWMNAADSLRTSSRAYYDANVRYPAHGFRVVRSP